MESLLTGQRISFINIFGDVSPEHLPVLLVLFIIFLTISFILSGAQTSFFTLDKRDLDLLQTKTKPVYKRIVNLLEQPRLLFSALYTANIFFNIVLIIISNALLNIFIPFDKLGITWLEYLIRVIIITLVILLFCETLPKKYARQNNLRFARDFGIVVEGAYYLFKRIGSWMLFYSHAIEKKISKKPFTHYLPEELEAVMENNPGNTATDQEKNMLKGILKFTNISVRQIMRPRPDVSGIEYDTDFETLQKKIEAMNYSRIPVYKNDLDEIVGIIHTKDILPYLWEKSDFDWLPLMRQPYFVHEQKMIVGLLKEFQQKRFHFAVVVDEFGGTSGIVTMEDILEEIMGDIKDEFDEDETGIRKLDDHNFIFDGRTMIYDVCKYLQIPLNTFDALKGESDSLGGLLLELAGRMPQKNEEIKNGGFIFTVLEMNKTRLQKIKVTMRSNENLPA